MGMPPFWKYGQSRRNGKLAKREIWPTKCQLRRKKKVKKRKSDRNTSKKGNKVPSRLILLSCWLIISQIPMNMKASKRVCVCKTEREIERERGRLEPQDRSS